MRQSGIYKIQSISHPERIYIGSAVYFKARWGNHLCGLRMNKHHSSKLQAYYNKYGEDDLVFSPLCVCDRRDLIPENGIIWIEQCFINAYAYLNDNKPWFNVSPMAGSNLGYKQPPAVVEKNRKARTGIKHSIESRKRRSEESMGEKNHMYGIEPWNKGKKGLQSQSAEARAKIGANSKRMWEERKSKNVA